MTDSANNFYLVAFEGIDGSGKSTIAPLVVKRLEKNSVPCKHRGEFMSPIGSHLRDHLNELTPFQKTLYFALDRSLTLNILSEEVKSLSSPPVVIWDRYTLSAYVCREMDIKQGLADSSLRPLVKDVNAVFPEPDLVVYFEIPVSKAVARVVDREFPIGDCACHEERLSLMSDLYSEMLEGQHITVDGLAKPCDITHTIVEAIKKIVIS